MNNLWGRYDLKTKKMAGFWVVTVISSHRIKCNTSIESSHQCRHFSFVHQQPLSNLRARYDPKTETKMQICFLVNVSYLHIEKCNSSVENSHRDLPFLPYTDKF